MKVDFVKMHGLGNDFVLVDATRQAVPLPPGVVRRVGDRHEGVGFDQLLVAAAPAGGADIDMQIFNTDGSTAEQCGNGLRCFARYVRDEGLVPGAGERLRVGTPQGVTDVHFVSDVEVEVTLPGPDFEPTAVPARFDARAPVHEVALGGGERLSLGIASMGNPHALLWVEEWVEEWVDECLDDVPAADVARLGAAIQASDAFPASVNVGFGQRISASHLRLRVFERGVGETRACGSGACAAVCIGRDQGRLAERVRVSLPGGDLHIGWPGEGAPVTMRGPTAYVFRGCLTLPSDETGE